MTKTVAAYRRLFTCMTSSSAPARDHHRGLRRRPPISVGCLKMAHGNREDQVQFLGCGLLGWRFLGCGRLGCLLLGWRFLGCGFLGCKVPLPIIFILVKLSYKTTYICLYTDNYDIRLRGIRLKTTFFTTILVTQ